MVGYGYGSLGQLSLKKSRLTGWMDTYELEKLPCIYVLEYVCVYRHTAMDGLHARMHVLLMRRNCAPVKAD